MTFIFFIGVIVLFVMHSQLQGRVTALEAELEAERRRGGITPKQGVSGVVSSTGGEVFQSHPESQYVPPDEVPFHPSVQGTSVPQADLGNAFVEWFQKDLLMKIGALFLLMGIGWFVGYAFIHEWIGEVGRITLGLLLGASVLVLGAWRIRTHEHQGAIFTVLGSTIVLLTVSAARGFYDMFDPYSALGLMFLSVLFVAYVSLRYERNSLALASLILAAVAPYLTHAPSLGLGQQFMYLLVIVLGTLWVVYATGWRNLTFAALCVVFLETSPYAVMPDEKFVALLWVFIFTAIFFVANIVSLVRQRGGITSKTNLFTALGTALFLVGWVFGVAPEEAQSLLFVLWMIVFSVGAYLVYRVTDIRSPFYVYGGTAVALLAAATVAELDGAVLTIAFTFEVAVLIFAATLLNLDRTVVRSLNFLFIGPIFLSLTSIVSSSWNTGVIHEDFFNLVILGLILTIVGVFTHERYPSSKANELGVGGSLMTMGVLYGLILLWLVLHALLADDVATMLTLIVYTVIGLISYYSGKAGGKNGLKTGGIAILVFVVARLLLVDVWNMELVGRIITFVAIGVLLLSTAFMGKRQGGNSQV